MRPRYGQPIRSTAYRKGCPRPIANGMSCSLLLADLIKLFLSPIAKSGYCGRSSSRSAFVKCTICGLEIDQQNEYAMPSTAGGYVHSRCAQQYVQIAQHRRAKRALASAFIMAMLSGVIDLLVHRNVEAVVDRARGVLVLVAVGGHVFVNRLWWRVTIQSLRSWWRWKRIALRRRRPK